MDENGTQKEKRKHKGDGRPSHPELEEVKKFKENLLQAAANGESIMAPATDSCSRRSISRERSLSRARNSLVIKPNIRGELDENKIFELKEAFLLFDMDGDGCIDHSDLRATLVSLGEKVDDQAVRTMLSEAPSPLDFDSFVELLGYRTLELDTEETLVAALSRWDRNNSGLISEDKLRHDLMTFGDRFSEKEADYALDEAPTVQKGCSRMIDYVKFCSVLSGLRKNKS